MILGTSITCSATGTSASTNWSTSTSCSAVSGTGASSGNGVDDLVHRVALNPLLRSGHGKELRLGCGESSGSWPCSSSRSGAYSLPGPQRRSSAHVSASHCLRRCAAPEPGCSLAIITERTRQKKGHVWVRQLELVCCVCVCCCCRCKKSTRTLTFSVIFPSRRLDDIRNVTFS